MNQLALAFLGTPEIRLNGAVIMLPTRKALALLAYLALEGGNHSREKLATLLWPESTAAHGRGTLRSTLGFLRAALGDAMPIVSERDLLRFAPRNDGHTDVQVLDAAWRAATTRAGEIPGVDPESLIAQLRAAAAVYRGDFLDGFIVSDAPAFEDWVSMQRERWHLSMDLVFDRLTQQQSERGALTEARDWATRWVRHAPFNEAAYRRVMQLHFACGDRPAAMRAFAACREMLLTEFDTVPAPETEALAERIRVDPPLGGERHTLRAKAPTGSLLTEAPLIGRAEEHRRLVAAYRIASRGGTQIVVVEGEPGIGKTRLAREFLRWGGANGVIAVQGRALETGGRVPYQPIVEILRDCLARDDDLRARLSDSWLAELSLLLPELRDRWPDLPAPLRVGDAEARTRLFDAIARLVHTRAMQRPLVLFLDDVQWADAASRDVLQYGVQHWGKNQTPLLIVGTARSEELEANPEIREWLTHLGRTAALTRITLGPLTDTDALQLARTLVSIEDESAFDRWLLSETGGHPLFLIETVKWLVEQGVLAADGRWLSGKGPWHDRAEGAVMPPGVREVIHARLARLSPAAVTLLITAAAIGAASEFDLLCDVAGLEESVGLLALEEVLRRSLLRESQGTYLFTHDKIREVTYAEASEARRRIIHRRAVQTLAPRGAPPAVLARHAQAAGLSVQAFRYNIAAGDEAMRLLAVRDAIASYEEARRILNHAGPIAEAELQHLSLQLGRAYEFDSAFAQARGVYEEMLMRARQERAAAMECAALNRLATVAALGDFDLEAAQAYLRDAVAVAEQANDRLWLAETEWNLAQLHFYEYDVRTSLVHSERALALARELDVPELIARSLNAIGLAKPGLCRWEEAVQHLDEARLIFAALGNRALEADSLGQMGNDLINAGRPREGIARARQARQISLEIENAWGHVSSTFTLAAGLREIGTYEEALALAQDAVAVARAQDQPMLMMISLTVLGSVHRALLMLPDAHAAHAEAMAINLERVQPTRMFTDMIAAELCADAVLAGQWPEAITTAQQALDAREYTFNLYMGHARWLETEALVRGGTVARAEEDIRRFRAAIGTNPRYRIPALRAMAVLAQADGADAEAVAHLREAEMCAEAIGLPGEQWSIALALADAYAALGDRDAAHGAYSRAATIVTALANGLTDTALRQSFLAAPLVARVMREASEALSQ